MFIYEVYSSAADHKNPDAKPIALFVAGKESTGDSDQGYYFSQIEEDVFPGCLVDPVTFKVIVKPKYRATRVESGYHSSREGTKYAVQDGTTINLYWLNGWRMSTYNSWDISKIKEYSVTYLEYFEESLKKNNINLDFESLDKTVVYPFMFCNPRVHLMSREHKVFYWGNELDHDFHQQVTVNEGAIDLADGYTLRGEDWVDVHTSIEYDRVSTAIYHERNKHSKKYENYHQSLYRHMCSIFLNRNIDNRLVTKFANPTVKLIFAMITSDCKAMRSGTMVRGFAVPDRILNETNIKGITRQVYDYKTIPFLLKIANYERITQMKL
jgi:hypothetical protein